MKKNNEFVQLKASETEYGMMEVFEIVSEVVSEGIQELIGMGMPREVVLATVRKAVKDGIRQSRSNEG